jgi:hypothetical protein
MKNKKKIIYFHIGYPKTATTFLQKNFFKKHPKLNYLSRHYGKIDTHLSNILTKIFDLNDKDFKKKKFFLKKELNNVNFLKNKVNLISEEDILCQRLVRDNDIIKTLKRINYIFNNEKIIIKYFYFVRNQKNIVVSCYRQFYLSYFFTRYPKFDQFLGKRNKGIPKEIFDSFKYNKIYSSLRKIVGKNNIKIFIYEDLKNNSKKCLQQLCKYLNIHDKLNNKIVGLKYEKTFESINHLNLFSAIKKNIKDYKTLIKYLPSKILRFTQIIYFGITKLYFVKKYLKSLPSQNINYKKKIKLFYFYDNKKFKNVIKIDY